MVHVDPWWVFQVWQLSLWSLQRAAGPTLYQAEFASQWAECASALARASRWMRGGPRWGGGRGWGGKFDFFPVSFLGKKKSKMVKKTELGDGCCWFSTHLKLFNTLDYFFEWDINEIDGGSVWQFGEWDMREWTSLHKNDAFLKRQWDCHGWCCHLMLQDGMYACKCIVTHIIYIFAMLIQFSSWLQLVDKHFMHYLEELDCIWTCNVFILVLYLYFFWCHFFPQKLGLLF